MSGSALADAGDDRREGAHDRRTGPGDAGLAAVALEDSEVRSRTPANRRESGLLKIMTCLRPIRVAGLVAGDLSHTRARHQMGTGTPSAGWSRRWPQEHPKQGEQLLRSPGGEEMSRPVGEDDEHDAEDGPGADPADETR